MLHVHWLPREVLWPGAQPRWLLWQPVLPAFGAFWLKKQHVGAACGARGAGSWGHLLPESPCRAPCLSFPPLVVPVGWAVGSGWGCTPAAKGVPLWGAGPGPRLHHWEPRAASMPGNCTLIRENKDGAGGWGWGTALPRSQAGAGGRGKGGDARMGPGSLALGTSPKFAN